MKSATLADVREGESIMVKRLHGTSLIRQRLMDMGIIRDSVITVVRYAPLKDPIHIMVKGYSLAIRISEGRMIEVK